jgi:hypothetical protein
MHGDHFLPRILRIKINYDDR